MNTIANQIKKLNDQGFLWNTIGSVISAGSTFVLLLCVTRTVGAIQGGIFSIALANAQLLLTVGKYGVRSYQATDISREISLISYMILRIFTCASMLIFCLAMIIIFQYDITKAEIVFAVCIIKMVDAVEDVYHGQLQLNGKMSSAGKLLAIRNLFTVILFGVVINMTTNLLLSSWATGLFSVLICLIMNHVVLERVEHISLSWKSQELKILARSCFPLFVGTFLSLYIYNAPKYAIDIYCTEESQTYYAIIFMPAFVINLFSEFAFKPMLTSLASWWVEGHVQKFRKIVWRLVGNIFLITILALSIMYTWGTAILSAIYQVDVTAYRIELAILMLGGGFSATVYFTYNVLTAMRLQRQILINYLLGAGLSSILAFGTVRIYGLLAAALTYLLAEVILCLLMIICMDRKSRSH